MLLQGIERAATSQAAPIVCSQFALLSPDSATSQQLIASNLRRQCLHVEKDAVSTEAEAMPAADFAAVDAAATVEATATLGTTTPHMPPTSQSRSPQRRCRSTPWLPRVFTVTLASLPCQCITSVCSRLNRSSRFSTLELPPPSSGSTRTVLTPRLRPCSKATLKANFPCRPPRLPVSPSTSVGTTA